MESGADCGPPGNDAGPSAESAAHLSAYPSRSSGGGRLYQHLQYSRKKRKKRYGKADARGQIKGRVSIDQNPPIVEEKSRIGDWEIDLVMGTKGQSALVSLVERRSRYTLLGKVLQTGGRSGG